ncbi:hypothetical protein [Plasmodium yoelii yoelii]|uniref:Uncharacterized protein n=1 Tax=Plasmodium yoelii yoelii TaxID=73239 RepID=Q7RJR1_PLAYO|nr:hypothetical protein [Plasmodium yoelii yoelii]
MMWVRVVFVEPILGLGLFILNIPLHYNIPSVQWVYFYC